MRCILWGAFVLRTFAITASLDGNDRSTTYPSTRRVEQVDRIHGSEVSDPYRWLEADIRQSKEVAA